VDGRDKHGHDDASRPRSCRWRSGVSCFEGRDGAPHPSWPGLSRQSTPLPRRNSRVSFETVRGGWIYIMTNRPNGTLYTGVTNNIALRAYEHRQGLIEGFTRCYRLKRLVLTEFY
jgi:GIY-YIG catalytic domain